MNPTARTRTGARWVLRANLTITRSQIESIHNAALELAERVGFEVRPRQLLERLRKEAGLTVRSGRVHLRSEQMQAFLRRHRKRHHDPAPNPNAAATLGVGDRPMRILADDDTSIRPLTRRDVVDGTKLVEMLHDRGVRGGAVGLPSDVPPLMAPFESILIGLRYARGGGYYTAHGATLWHTEYLEKIARVRAGSFGLSVWTPSPFRLEGNELDIALAMEGRFDSLAVGSMPLMGMTAPMDAVKTWTQALAETIGGATILQALYPSVAVDFYPHSRAADMATGGYGFGLPEWDLLDLLKWDILPFYGLRPPWGKCTMQGAAQLGAQAQQEFACSVLPGYLMGYREFASGVLAGGDVFSVVKLFQDLETLSWVERFGRGFEWTDPRKGMDAWVKQARSGRLFAENESEARKARRLYRHPRYFVPTSVGQFESAPRNLSAEMKAETRELIARHQYAPDAAMMREVERIVDYARQNPPR